MPLTQDFRLARLVNYTFYMIEGLIALLVTIIVRKTPAMHSLTLLGYILMSMTIMRNVIYRFSPRVQMKWFTALFTILNVIMSFAFDSAQVFIYGLCLTSILSFLFIDQKHSRFQLIFSLITSIVVGECICMAVHSFQTMLEYTFGMFMLLVVNFIAVMMCNTMTFQTRRNYEQERSLDDMLRVVEAKCEEALAGSQSKTRFLANMSHEIRTPINSFMGMNEMIMRESKDPVIREYAAEAHTSAESLLYIINTILDITKIEAGKLVLVEEEYDLPKLIHDVVSPMRYRAERNNLSLILDIAEDLPTRLIGDEQRIRQILTNLLSNAVKYTRFGTVTLVIRRVNENKLLFSVKDTGIGIKKEDMTKLFDAFERIEESRNRHIEGTGLGLNITTSLLDMMDSKLEVKSKYGKGSEFYFYLEQEIVDATPIGRFSDRDHIETQKDYRVQFEAPDAKVLVVDDNAVNRRVFVQLLKATKLHIEEAASGMECLEKTAKTHYDIIFMDHMMPKMDGIETFKAIRADEGNLCNDVPVIALTANAVSGAKEFYLSEGFTGYLSKPIEPARLENTIATLLSGDLLMKPAGEESAPETEQKELPIIEGVDWGYARLHFGDDEALLDTMRMFSASIKKDAEELDRLLDTIDTDDGRGAYRVQIHSMKNTAATVGIVQLAGMAMEIEKAAKTGRCDIIRGMHPIYIRRWREYKELLSVFDLSSSSDKNASDHIQEIEQIFADIRNAAEDMDVDKLDAQAKLLDEFKYESDQKDWIEQVKTMILGFEIEKLMTVSFTK